MAIVGSILGTIISLIFFPEQGGMAAGSGTVIGVGVGTAMYSAFTATEAQAKQEKDKK